MKVPPVVVAFALFVVSRTAVLTAQQPETVPVPPSRGTPAGHLLPSTPGVVPAPQIIGDPAVRISNDAKWNVVVDVQMIALPQELALVFMGDLQSPDDAKVEAAIGQLQDLLKKKQATLLGWPRIVSADQDRATAETVVEQRYPTEWDPAILVPDAPPTPPTPPAPKSPASVSPAAFETRNIGATLEVEPKVINDGQEIVLSLNAQRVSLLEFKSYTVGLSKDGAAVHIEQPQFTTSRIQTTVKVRSGQPVLLGTHLLGKPENHIEFVILRAVTKKMR